MPGVHIPIRVRFDPVDVKEVAESAPLRQEGGRRLRLTDRMFAEFGYSDGVSGGCEGCRWKQAGLKETRGH